MKKIKIVWLVALLVSISTSAEAQFLKKLQKAVERGVERGVINTVERKVHDKSAEKTGDAMDSALDPKIGGNEKNDTERSQAGASSILNNVLSKTPNQVDINSLPRSYTFDYLYALKMSTAEGVVNTEYYLHTEKPYMASKIDQGPQNMSMILDSENNVQIMVMDDIVSAMEIPFSGEISAEDAEYNNTFKIKKLPNKTFLGYNCLGYEMENKDHKIITYVAPHMEVSFQNIFNSPQQGNSMPTSEIYKVIGADVSNGLMMYMELTDKKSRKKNKVSTMECVAYKPINKVINIRK